MADKYRLLFLALVAVALLTLPATMQAGTNLGLQLSSSPDTIIAFEPDVFAGL